MSKFETSLHLYQSPIYHSEKTGWVDAWQDAILNTSTSLSWDITALLSYVSFGYVCSDRTLIQGISRNPWLSNIDNQGSIFFEKIPPHGRKWASPQEIATRLIVLLEAELLKVCQGKKDIFILLSGGLDSRVIAAVFSKLVQEDSLSSRPIAVTWGLPNSRDVVYASKVARILNLEWKNIAITPEMLLENVALSAKDLGCLISPIHLHGMSWFQNVTEDSLVLNASYGDSVGRAEFSRRHVLELRPLRPRDSKEILQSHLWGLGLSEFSRDMNTLHGRSDDKTKYVLYELEMQSNYMRNMIAHAMSAINKFCHVYNTFTDPNVYSFMWSFHPSARIDHVYFELLMQINKQMLDIPWARTNKPLSRNRYGAEIQSLKKEFHDYDTWISKDLFHDLSKLVVPEWFEEVRLFNIQAITNLLTNIAHGNHLQGNSELFVWLAAFRYYVDWLYANQKQVLVPQVEESNYEILPVKNAQLIQRLNVVTAKLQKSKIYLSVVKPLRQTFRRTSAKIIYPPSKE